MSSINKHAPYAYLAKRVGNNYLYDLYLLVPVGSTGDTDLSNVSVQKVTDTRFKIDYSTTTSAASVPYRFKHWEIDTEQGDFKEIEIQGDNNASRRIVLAFYDADTQAATSSNDQHTCAPYLNAKVETTGSAAFVHMSCVVLFESGQVLQNESIIFGTNKCEPKLTLGNGSTTPDISKLLINQDVKAKLVYNEVYAIEADLTDTSNLSKPPRKNKVKVLWT